MRVIRFENLKKKNHIDERLLPISAMNYDGLFLEDLIEGYRTLVVSGREMMSVDIKSDDRNIGSVIASQRIPARTIKVDYQVTNHDSEMILVNYRYLVESLYREKDVPIYFNDEPDVIYYGRFSSSDEPSGSSYDVVSSFEILCSDPRKYSLKTFSTDGDIMRRLPFKTKPLKITVKTKNNGGITVTDGTKNIKISQSLKAGDLVVFDFSLGQVLINGINKTNLLDLTSDFENFYLKQRQKITCSNGTLTVEYKEVMY